MSTPDKSQPRFSKRNPQISDAEMEQIRSSLQGLMFGSVSITVQDGVVVQIDRTEKRRIRSSAGESPSQ